MKLPGLTYANWKQQLETFEHQRAQFETDDFRGVLATLRLFTPVIPALLEALGPEFNALDELRPEIENALHKIEKDSDAALRDRGVARTLTDWLRISARVNEIMNAVRREQESLRLTHPGLDVDIGPPKSAKK